MANNALELTGEVDVISQAKVPYINFISSLNVLNSHTLCLYFVHGVTTGGGWQEPQITPVIVTQPAFKNAVKCFS